MKGSLEVLSNRELLVATHALVRRGLAVEADLLVHLGEVDARRLYLEEACSSMFVYCVRVLHFSEAAAYKRIRAARAARKHPELLASLRQGELHVTALSLLAAQLTRENCGELILAARHKTAEQIKRLLADRQPKPDVADCVRRIPARALMGNAEPPPLSARAALPIPKSNRTNDANETGNEAWPGNATRTGNANGRGGSAEARLEPGLGSSLAISPSDGMPVQAAPRSTSRPTTTPLGGERYRISFTADGELHAQLQELRALMRHRVPDGDLASILGRAVALLLEQVRKQKFAEVSKPNSARPQAGAATRQIPAAIRRTVARRDGGSCSYVSAQGRRCGGREFLEFHHLDAWARSGTHSVDGIALRCRAHNQYAACLDFGEQHMARFRRRARAVSQLLDA